MHPGEPIQVLLDSLLTALEQAPDSEVRRSPQDEGPQSYSELVAGLYNEGFNPRRAVSHVYIRYCLRIEPDGRLVESIDDLYFLYRGQAARTDVPILYLDGTDPTVRRVLAHGGIPGTINLRAIVPFRHVISLMHLLHGTDQPALIVEMGRQTIRTEAERGRADNLIAELRKHVGTGGSYVVRTREVR